MTSRSAAPTCACSTPAGEFTAEVVTSPAGQFRFFAAPGNWTLRALSRPATATPAVAADRGVNEVAVAVAAEP